MTSTTSPEQQSEASGALPPRARAATVFASPTTAIAAVWICSALLAILAPDMVTGSEQEHLPIAAMTVWLWTLAATGYIILGARGGSSLAITQGIVAVWCSVLVAGIAAPVMVTGSDPTQIPLAVMLVPCIGALATGFLALHQATRRVL